MMPIRIDSALTLKNIGQVIFDYMLIDMQAVTELYSLKRRAWLHQHAAAMSEEQLKKLHKSLLGSDSMPRHLLHSPSPCSPRRTPILEATEWGEEQEAELERYLQDGFPDWTQKDLMAFKSSMLRNGGRGAAVEHMQRALPHKPPQHVARYTKAFWERGPTMLRTWPTILKQLDEADRLRITGIP